MDLGELGQGSTHDVKSFLTQPAENYGNDTNIEAQWAVKAFHHSEVYFSLIKTVDPSLLKLTPHDDDIYKHFREQFKDFNVEKVNEDEMKSVDGKKQWREFCEQYKGRVEDYNMGSLMRINANDEVKESNTTLVPRIQFLAIEIARNREGCNSNLRKKFGVAAAAGNKKDTNNADENSNAEKS